MTETHTCLLKKIKWNKLHAICRIIHAGDWFDIQITKLILNLYLQYLAESVSCPAFTNNARWHRRKKKKQKASNAYKRFNYSRFIVIRKHVGGSSADFVCICANSRYLLGYWKDYRQKGKTFLQDSQSRQEAYWKSNQNLSEKAVQILKNWASLQVFTSYSQSSHLILTWTTWSED